jgi:hypothetical protein
MQNLWWRRLKAHLPAFGSVGTARAVVKNVRRRKTAFVVVDGVARYSWSSCAIFLGPCFRRGELAKKPEGYY